LFILCSPRRTPPEPRTAGFQRRTCSDLPGNAASQRVQRVCAPDFPQAAPEKNANGISGCLPRAVFFLLSPMLWSRWGRSRKYPQDKSGGLWTAQTTLVAQGTTQSLRPRTDFPPSTFLTVLKVQPHRPSPVPIVVSQELVEPMTCFQALSPFSWTQATPPAETKLLLCCSDWRSRYFSEITKPSVGKANLSLSRYCQYELCLHIAVR
jgi:hypothetical protein